LIDDLIRSLPEMFSQNNQIIILNEVLSESKDSPKAAFVSIVKPDKSSKYSARQIAHKCNVTALPSVIAIEK